jgi:hypothetical protein
MQRFCPDWNVLRLTFPRQEVGSYRPQDVTRQDTANSTGLLQCFRALDGGMIEQECFENGGSM